MFYPLQNYLTKAANKMGIGQEFQAVQICKAAETALAKILPSYNREKVFAKSFNSGRLTISVKSSSWSQEITMRKGKIISEVNTQIGKNLVKELRTCLSS